MESYETDKNEAREVGRELKGEKKREINVKKIMIMLIINIGKNTILLLSPSSH